MSTGKICDENRTIVNVFLLLEVMMKVKLHCMEECRQKIDWQIWKEAIQAKLSSLAKWDPQGTSATGTMKLWGTSNYYGFFGWWEEKGEERGGISLISEKREEKGVVSHSLIQTNLRNQTLSFLFRWANSLPQNSGGFKTQFREQI